VAWRLRYQNYTGSDSKFRSRSKSELHTAQQDTFIYFYDQPSRLTGFVDTNLADYAYD
jgi:hypothetical protein